MAISVIKWKFHEDVQRDLRGFGGIPCALHEIHSRYLPYIRPMVQGYVRRYIVHPQNMTSYGTVSYKMNVVEAVSDSTARTRSRGLGGWWTKGVAELLGYCRLVARMASQRGSQSGDGSPLAVLSSTPGWSCSVGWFHPNPRGRGWRPARNQLCSTAHA